LRGHELLFLCAFAKQAKFGVGRPTYTYYLYTSQQQRFLLRSDECGGKAQRDDPNFVVKPNDIWVFEAVSKEGKRNS
jgi:hypothetical protein